MYELIQAGEKTYYINCPAKMGLYRLNDSGCGEKGSEDTGGRRMEA